MQLRLASTADVIRLQPFFSMIIVNDLSMQLSFISRRPALD